VKCSSKMWLGIRKIYVLLQGASKTNISLIVSDEEASGAVRGLHREFFESQL
jgi:aspartokinase